MPSLSTRAQKFFVQGGNERRGSRHNMSQVSCACMAEGEVAVSALHLLLEWVFRKSNHNTGNHGSGTIAHYRVYCCCPHLQPHPKRTYSVCGNCGGVAAGADAPPARGTAAAAAAAVTAAGGITLRDTAAVPTDDSKPAHTLAPAPVPPAPVAAPVAHGARPDGGGAAEGPEAQGARPDPGTAAGGARVPAPRRAAERLNVDAAARTA